MYLIIKRQCYWSHPHFPCKKKLCLKSSRQSCLYFTLFDQSTLHTFPVMYTNKDLVQMGELETSLSPLCQNPKPWPTMSQDSRIAKKWLFNLAIIPWQTARKRCFDWRKPRRTGPGPLMRRMFAQSRLPDVHSFTKHLLK